jgi:tubulin--tyrosine ligase/tubulin polyglutamylase TTLL9
VFYCREGHLKGSSEIYDINVTDKFVHITNHSLQKMSENFEKFECGNEMSYQDFKNYLQSEGITLDKFDMLVQQMKYLIEVSMNAVGKKLLNNEKVLCFEIFGYDFIVDNMFKPWILEINSNPGLGISSPVIAKLVPRMIDDAFRLTIDKVFETVYDDTVIDKESKLYKSKYALDGFSDDENIFEFICNIMNK